MPWDIYKNDGEYCVHKKKPDGTKGTKEACHPTKAEAEDQLQALYASEEKEMKLIDFLVKAVDQDKEEEIKSILEKRATQSETTQALFEKDEFDEDNIKEVVEMLKKGTEPNDMVNVLAGNLEKMLEDGTMQEKMYDVMPSESYSLPHLDVETFNELDKQRQLDKKKEDFRKESSDFVALFENIVYGDGDFSEKGRKVVSLANDYADRVENNFNSEDKSEKDINKKEGVIEKIAGRVIDLLTHNKEKGEDQEETFMVFKDDQGNLRWIAKYSNNFRDDEREIIAEKSHRRFVDLVDKGLAPYPELYIWHEKDWKIGVADWLAYDDAGYAVASGPIDKEAEEVALWLNKLKDIRTSHGMPRSTIKRDKEDPSVIVEHESREVTVIPKSRAANKLTGWVTIEKDLQEDRMIPEKKKKQLTDQWGIDPGILESLEKANEAEANAAEEIGIDRKDIDEEEAPQDEAVEKDEESPEAETEEEELKTFATKEEVSDALAMVAKALSKQISELSAKIDSAEKNVEKEVEKKMTEIPSASVSAMLAKKLSITNEDGNAEEVEVDGRTKLAKSKPKEAPEKVKERTGIPFVDQMLSQEGED